MAAEYSLDGDHTRRGQHRSNNSIMTKELISALEDTLKGSEWVSMIGTRRVGGHNRSFRGSRFRVRSFQGRSGGAGLGVRNGSGGMGLWRDLGIDNDGRKIIVEVTMEELGT